MTDAPKPAPRVGDKLALPEATVINTYDDGYVQVGFEGAPGTNYLPPAVIAAARIIPRPIQVGDRVHTTGFPPHNNGEVRFVDDDGQATVRWGNGHTAVRPVDDLTRLPDEGPAT